MIVGKSEGNEEKNGLFNKGAGTTVRVHAQKVNPDTDLISFIKTNSKLIRDLIVNAKLLHF